MLRDFSKLLAGVGALAEALLAAPRVEAAAPFYVGLRYELLGSTEDCWDAGEFTRNVARAVGYDPFRSTDGLSVSIQVRDTTGSLDGSVTWTDASGARIGERRFVARDRDCPKLLREMSFAVALQIDLLRPNAKEEAADGAAPTASGETNSQPATAAPATSNPAAKASAPAPTANTRARAERRALGDATAETPDARTTRARGSSLRFSVGAGPSLAWRLSPSVTGQGRLFVGARRGGLSLELAAEATLPVEERLDDGSGFRQSLAGGSAAVCAHHEAFGACAVGKLSRISVTGLDVDEPRSPSALVGQAGARLGAVWGLSETWWLSPHIDALGLLTPREVSVNQVTVWEMPVLSLSAGIDVAARF